MSVQWDWPGDAYDDTHAFLGANHTVAPSRLGRLMEKLASYVRKALAETVEGQAPIPMILTCPACRARHIDEGEFAVKPHHTHACQSCGMVWRPAIVPTVGVQFLPGFVNAPPPRFENIPPGPTAPLTLEEYAQLLSPCTGIAPPGWECSRHAGHSGPCAARPKKG